MNICILFYYSTVTFLAEIMWVSILWSDSDTF